MKNKAEDKQSPPPPPPSTTASPPSTSSSPAHEFSFTISLHQSTKLDKTKPLPSFAIDLTPADDIFFHGHLLPLHLLSHLPVSPRSSTNSLDSFTLPIHELQNPTTTVNTQTPNNHHRHHQNNRTKDSKIKPKSFSFFGIPKWRKGCEVREKEEGERQKKKVKFDVSHVLKRYMRMVRPLLSFRGKRSNLKFYNQPHSFSGNLSSRPDKQDWRGRRGEFSAPASMRTSPTNSGLLVAKGGQLTPTSTSDSTMEELQAAIQAAITHCKNSNATDDKKNPTPKLASEV